MPDLERTLDDLKIELASTPAEKAYAKGFKHGKTRARVESLIAIIFSITAIVIVAVNKVA